MLSSSHDFANLNPPPQLRRWTVPSSTLQTWKRTLWGRPCGLPKINRGQAGPRNCSQALSHSSALLQPLRATTAHCPQVGSHRTVPSIKEISLPEMAGDGDTSAHSLDLATGNLHLTGIVSSCSLTSPPESSEMSILFRSGREQREPQVVLSRLSSQKTCTFASSVAAQLECP